MHYRSPHASSPLTVATGCLCTSLAAPFGLLLAGGLGLVPVAVAARLLLGWHWARALGVAYELLLPVSGSPRPAAAPTGKSDIG